MSKSVSMSFSPIAVGKGGLDDGVHFEVRDDGALVGRLSVMRKRLRWWPQGEASAREIGWTDFDALMRAQTSTEKKEA